VTWRRRVRRVLFPIAEARFTYARYDALLARLAAARATVVPLRELAAANASGGTVVALRHDVDESLESALNMARLEHARGLRATYFVLHTAPYWTRPDLVDALRRLQDDYGHEVGWHNDLVTLQCIHGVDSRDYLARELDRLRSAGLSIVGSASHGSPYCYRYGYHNNYFFSDFDGEVAAGFPNTTVVEGPRGRCRIAKGTLDEFGFAYEAYHLDNDAYFSDTATTSGSRWHPDALDPASLAPGTKAIILTHPCHWDPSVPAKVARLGRLVVSRLGSREP
jgi:hypothetical protein